MTTRCSKGKKFGKQVLVYLQGKRKVNKMAVIKDCLMVAAYDVQGLSKAA